MMISNHRNSYAYTLIEVLVVISVIGLLVALIIPAVQFTREAARRAQCTNNLKQLGIALNNYESSVGAFPGSTNGSGYSFHVMILPFMDQGPLYNSFNFAYAPTDGFRLNTQNSTSSCTSINGLICPSDNLATAGTAWTNYPGNTGYGYQTYGYNGIFVPQSMNPSGIRDGLSQTVMISEWVLGTTDGLVIVGNGEGSHTAKQGSVEDDRLTLHTTQPLTAPNQLELFMAACRGLTEDQADIAKINRGEYWSSGQIPRSLYNHTLPPGSHCCLNGEEVLTGIWTAGSRHRGVVMSLFADGHVKAVQTAIATKVWQSLGSRAGGESVSDNGSSF